MTKQNVAYIKSGYGICIDATESITTTSRNEEDKITLDYISSGKTVLPTSYQKKKQLWQKNHYIKNSWCGDIVVLSKQWYGGLNNNLITIIHNILQLNTQQQSSTPGTYNQPFKASPFSYKPRPSFKKSHLSLCTYYPRYMSFLISVWVSPSCE